ncbi:MAG: type VI secretion system membrane subunit TssM [Pseudomonadota bacterium]
MTRLFTWLSAFITTLGVMSLCVAIWIGLPILEIEWLAREEVRAGLIAGILTLLLIGALLRWRARRKAARELEDSLLATQAGDGPLLAERMRAALVRLKKTGGANALYDLPWYILIGPPGAGKTTALVHSGLDFPGEHAASITGFGGTKNCDFWFAEEAVMIDTAGRYTTQDSDATADRNSWSSFLGQLKTARPDQPINGVILAFSCSDMMTETPEGLKRHAETVRARLAELNDAFKTHVPVYVIFTKADMIAGFREYFGSFDESRRKGVWGATFQTRNRREETHRAVSREFDQLISRLSDEVTDRLMEETESATRIAIFDFPEQMALLERNVTTFLSAVFEKPQSIRAILRGFYFTSGTQDGTPIDQVLGAMSGGAGAASTGFLSGKGRSYFLHDLLTKVIFAERDWVGYDRGRVLRRAVGRAFGKTVIGVASVVVMGVLGFSFWTNATLVREVAGTTQTYQQRAGAFLGPQRIDDPATRPVLEALNTLRAVPAGYANPRPQEVVEDLGLSRRDMLRGAAVQAYSDALEQLLRPRMMLRVENDLAQYIVDDRKIDAYRALKVYILLAKEQDGREDDLAIQSYFAQAWAEEYAGADGAYRAVNAHLAAMLELDSRVTPLIAANGALIARVREAIADVSPAARAWGAIRAQASTLPVWRLDAAMGDASLLATTDGRPLATLAVPGLFTFQGYWEDFAAAAQGAGAQLEADAWVLGAADTQPLQPDATLAAELAGFYARDFEQAWDAMLSRVAVAQGGADAAGAVLVRLATVVDAQTRLAEGSGGDGALVQARRIARPFEPWHLLMAGTAGARPLDRVLAGLAQAGQIAATGQGDLGAVLPADAPYPEAVLRIVGQVRAALSPQFVDARLTALDRGRCGPDAPRAGAAFAPVFGPGGEMERLAATAPGPVSPFAAARFASAERIRAAFFQPGQGGAAVPFGVRLIAVTPPVAPVTLIMGGQTLDLVPGAAPAQALWREGALMAMAVPDAPLVPVPGQGWSILSFLSGPDLQTQGPLAQVSHRIGPYTATFRLEFQGEDVPFLSNAFKEITCR